MGDNQSRFLSTEMFYNRDTIFTFRRLWPDLTIWEQQRLLNVSPRFKRFLVRFVTNTPSTSFYNSLEVFNDARDRSFGQYPPPVETVEVTSTPYDEPVHFPMQSPILRPRLNSPTSLPFKPRETFDFDVSSLMADPFDFIHNDGGEDSDVSGPDFDISDDDLLDMFGHTSLNRHRHRHRL